jgi:hypothetical protein
MVMFVVVHIHPGRNQTLEVAAAALNPSLSTTPIKAAVEVFLGSNETRAEPTATFSTLAPGTDFSALVTLDAHPPQCIP